MRTDRTTTATPAALDADHRAAEVHDHDCGLGFDLSTIGRRRALQLFAVGGLATLVGCGSSGSDGASSTTAAAESASSSDGASSSAATSSSGASTADGSSAIPEETGGPYPGDGSNGPNVLDDSGIVRRDITSSFGSASGVADGVPLTIEMKLIDVAGGGGPLAGAAVYLWHCDQEGRYSLYSPGVTEENYLRGVQESDADGAITFTSIYPAAYDGRWPHIHFEVYESLDTATSSGTKLRTSQLALPEDTDALVYATDGYEASVSNLARTSLETDMVFGDGWASQLATVTGSVGDGLVATLNVGV